MQLGHDFFFFFFFFLVLRDFGEDEVNGYSMVV